ncbi:hypothetical protein [Rhodoferax aquaticus]|uniref:Uncharacterized protein n=1 Tax=Rhodoferax aquaticus TaxID=2527691 RepID=A0A515EQ70_9BURK|nr:hypothetical protein [Rhodoferax aquaticus]QDL54780.1 hypothetical protein EXZ61_11690 [Rhodoferax aquaticus]
MQINRLNHLQFPPDSSLPSALKKTSATSNAPALAAPTAAPEIQRSDNLPGSVVLKINNQASVGAEQLGDKVSTPDASMYSNLARNTASPAPAIKPADIDNMSLENQLALGRNMGVFTKISLNKDGVLVAKAQTPASSSPPEFVSSAVNTMRDYAEGIAALKKGAGEGDAKVTSGLSAKFQQLTAKLNVFA